MSATTPKPPSAPASLSLEFNQDESAGRTVLSASEQAPPLQIVRAFDLADGSALVHLHNVSGGLLGGDRLALRVKVGTGASAQLTTTGATRVYRRREDRGSTTQATYIDVGQNSLLEYVPDAIIPFAGARFSQHTTVRLASGAGLFWWEIVAPGREARGEAFQYESLEMKTDLWISGRLAAAERIRIEPQQQDISSPARLGPYPFWATFYICRAGLSQAAWLSAEEKLRTVALELVRPGVCLWGVSTLVADGLAVRALAVHGRHVVSGLHTLWSAAKLLLYGREPIPPRKIN